MWSIFLPSEWRLLDPVAEAFLLVERFLVRGRHYWAAEPSEANSRGVALTVVSLLMSSVPSSKHVVSRLEVKLFPDR